MVNSGMFAGKGLFKHPFVCHIQYDSTVCKDIYTICCKSSNVHGGINVCVFGACRCAQKFLSSTCSNTVILIMKLYLVATQVARKLFIMFIKYFADDLLEHPFFNIL